MLVDEERLFDAYLRGELSEPEAKQLCEALEMSPELGARLCEHIEFSAAMLVSCSQIDAVEINPVASSFLNVKPDAALQLSSAKKSGSSWISLAALAALVAVLVVAISLLNQSNEGQRVHGFVVQKSSTELYRNGQDLSSSVKLSSDQSLVLENAEGTSVTCFGPATLDLYSDRRIAMSEGKVKVQLGEMVEEFVLESPIMRVEDLGTAFGCEIKEQVQSVHVLDGEVRLVTATEQWRVRAGNAWLVQSNGKIKEVLYEPALFSDHTQQKGEHQLRSARLNGGETLLLKLSGKVDSLKFGLSPQMMVGLEEPVCLKVTLDGKPQDSIYLDVSQGAKSVDLNNLAGADELELNLVGVLEFQPLAHVMLESVSYQGSAGVDFPRVLIAAASEWEYSELEPISSEWKNVGWVARGWSSGQASFVSDAEGVTELGSAEEAWYLRQRFQLDDLPSSGQGDLLINLRVDDGAVLYLNGSELLRYAMSGGEVHHTSWATKRMALDTAEFKVFRVPASLLREGENVVAVSVHQYNIHSEDRYFDLSLHWLLP